MAQTVCVLLSTSDTSDRNQPRKYIERALAVLASVERRLVRRVATEVAVSCPMVWRWQQRFAEEGPDGLLRDKTRKPGKPPILAGTVARVVALTCGDPPADVTHWTGRAMAKVAGISLRSVQRIWDAHQLQPHRVRSFKRSRDPRFAEKMADVVASTSIRLPTRWCCRSTRRARSKRSTARSRGCRSSPVAAAHDT